MDPRAWSAYQAVVIARAVATRLEDFNVDAAIELLEADATELGLTKPTLGSGPTVLRFRASDHQLLQPLYVVEIDPQAEWSNRVSGQLALAEPVAVVGSTLQRAPTEVRSDDGEPRSGDRTCSRYAGAASIGSQYPSQLLSRLF